MSRHNFSNIVKNKIDLVAKYDLDNGDTEIEEPCDRKGFGLLEWLDNAVVGWDVPLQTYFLQSIEDGDSLVWWLGTHHAEIPTFDLLCSAVNEIFDHEVNFEFVDLIEKN